MVDIKELAKDEKIKAFKKLPKEKLIEMLIQCNTLLSAARVFADSIDGNPQYSVTYVPDKKPYCCVVCGGNGLVPKGFYQIVTSAEAGYEMGTEMCRSCNGRGVIMA